MERVGDILYALGLDGNSLGEKEYLPIVAGKRIVTRIAVECVPDGPGGLCLHLEAAPADCGSCAELQGDLESMQECAYERRLVIEELIRTIEAGATGEVLMEAVAAARGALASPC